MPISSLEKKCLEKGLKMTEQRKVIARVITSSHDHPDVEEVYKRASKLDKSIGIATVYRTVRLFEENGIVEKHDFGDGRARYEEHSDEHHDHIINVKTREIIEFYDKEIEELQEKIAEKHGYKLIGHKMELYVTPKK
jgi:Fur family transcriptional regulator, ferric uptake regulator